MILLMVSMFATWRVSSLLVHESGPYDILGRFRDWVGVAYDEHSRPYGRNVVAAMLLCLWCTSVWVGWAIAILTVPESWVLHGLAYSAGAILIDQWLRRNPNRCYLRGWTPLGLLNTVLGCLFNRVLAKHIDEAGKIVKWSFYKATRFPPARDDGKSND